MGVSSRTRGLWVWEGSQEMLAGAMMDSSAFGGPLARRYIQGNCLASAAHVQPCAFSKTTACNPSVKGCEMRSWQGYKPAALGDDFELYWQDYDMNKGAGKMRK